MARVAYSRDVNADSPRGFAEAQRPLAAPTTTRTDDLAMYKIAYDEARKQVEAQRDELERARTRAVQFLAFVGTSTAFLVGTTLRGAERDSVFNWLALSATALFGVSILLLVELLLALHWRGGPRRFKWRFVEPSSGILVFIDKEVPAPNEVHLTQLLSYQYNGHWHHNKVMLSRLRYVYAACITTALVQLCLWTTTAWIRGAERLLP